MKINKTRGFTLIELLVVISIVGLLSSVVLASLSTARNRSRDTAIVSSILQIRNLMNLEFSDTGSYSNLQGGWILDDTYNCDINRFPSTTGTPNSKYATNVIEICNKIRSDLSSTGQRLFVGAVSNAVTAVAGSSFTIIGRLPSGTGNDYYCAGHNGRTSRGTSVSGTWPNPGCWGDPTNK